MKRKFTLLFIATSAAVTLNAQVLLQEDFTSSFALNAATGWTVLNVSDAADNSYTATTGYTTTSVWQYPGNTIGTFNSGGNFIPFISNSYNGGSGEFISVGYESTTNTTTGTTLSNWLISPTVTIQNGNVFRFATRTTGIFTTTFPDRLQLRMSTTEPYSAPSGTTATGVGVGSFSTLLFDVNPGLSTSTSSTIVGGNTTAGYPQSWTIYTVQITGVPTPVTGRFAFRYYVTNGGSGGTNSAWIGIDGVKYVGPCIIPSVTSYTVCQNMPVTLNTFGDALPATAYSWTNTATGGTYTGASITTTANGTLGATDIYSVQVLNGSTSCGIYTTAALTTSNTVSMNIVTTSTNLCAGDDATLTVVSAANNYTWSTGAQTSSIVVSPNTNTVYTVDSGAFGSGCTGNAVVNINVLPLPVITASPVNAGCPGSTLTLGASGGVGYVWDVDILANYITTTGGTLNITLPSTVNVSFPGGTYGYTVYGIGNNNCAGAASSDFTIGVTPTISVISSTSICQKGGALLEADGADTYSWTSGNVTLATISAANATNNPVQITTGSIPGTASSTTVNITVKGKSEDGCLGTKTQLFKINQCLGIEVNGEIVETSVYPNPFANELHVDALIGRVEIYNALGQAVMNIAIKESGTINTADLAKGVYILKAFNEQGQSVKTTKLMKN